MAEFLTEIHIKNRSDLMIRAGMTATIDLIFSDSGDRLAIPDYALISKDKDFYVYKVQNGIAEFKSVSLAGTFGSQVFIKDGLVEGDTIVVVGLKNLGVDTKIWIEELY